MQNPQSLQQRLTAANLAALELTLAEAAAGPASPAVQVTPRAAAEPASPVTPITPRASAAEPAADAEADDSEDNLTVINNQTEINHDELQSLHGRHFDLDRECQHLQQELQQRNLTISQLNSQLGHGEALPPLAEAAAAEAGPATPRAAARVLVTDVAADLDDTLSFVTGVTVIPQEVELQRLHESITNFETQRLQLQQQIQQSDAMIAQLTAEIAQAQPAPLAENVAASASAVVPVVAVLVPAAAAPQAIDLAAQLAEQAEAVRVREQAAKIAEEERIGLQLQALKEAELLVLIAQQTQYATSTLFRVLLRRQDVLASRNILNALAQHRDLLPEHAITIAECTQDGEPINHLASNPMVRNEQIVIAAINTAFNRLFPAFAPLRTALLDANMPLAFRNAAAAVTTPAGLLAACSDQIAAGSSSLTTAQQLGVVNGIRVLPDAAHRTYIEQLYSKMHW